MVTDNEGLRKEVSKEMSNGSGKASNGLSEKEEKMRGHNCRTAMEPRGYMLLFVTKR